MSYEVDVPSIADELKRSTLDKVNATRAVAMGD
jgi:hypothetical protein